MSDKTEKFTNLGCFDDVNYLKPKRNIKYKYIYIRISVE